MARIQIELSGQPVTLDVPQGMDPAQYAEQVGQRHAGQETYDASTGGGELRLGGAVGVNTGIETPEWLDRGLAGVGRGMTNVARQVGNMTGQVSDEELDQAATLDQDLLNTTAGQVGNFVGEVAATAPVGGAAVGVGKAAGTAAARGMLPRAIAKATASPLGVMAMEGAGTGAILAGPDERGQGAAAGTAIAGSLGLAGKGLKRALAKPWVNKTDEAVQMEAMTGTNVPLSHSAEKGIVKKIYEGIVSTFPGVGSKFRGQYDDALQDFRRYVAEEALPPGIGRELPDTDDMQTIMGALRQKWDEAYDFDFKDVPMKLGSVDNYGLPRIADKALKKMWPKSVKMPKPGDTVSGQDILNLKATAQQVINKTDATEKGYIKAMKDWRDSLDDVLKQNLDIGNGPLAQEYKRYENLAPFYTKYQDVLHAANKATDAASAFQPKQLLKSTNQRSHGKGAEGGGALNDEAKLASKIFKGWRSEDALFQNIAALHLASSAMGFGVGGPVGAAMGAALPYALSKQLAKPGVQRALAGQLPTQRALARTLRTIQPAAEAVGRHATRAATVGATSE